MKHPIRNWTYEYVESIRYKSTCIGQPISCAFTNSDRQQALAKLHTLYCGRVFVTFAEKILYLSELY